MREEQGEVNEMWDWGLNPRPGKGHCWENCPIENWFFQLKSEWLVQFDKLTKKQAIEEIKKYVHWYNNERIQKKLGYLSPVQYRLKYSN